MGTHRDLDGRTVTEVKLVAEVSGRIVLDVTFVDGSHGSYNDMRVVSWGAGSESNAPHQHFKWLNAEIKFEYRDTAAILAEEQARRAARESRRRSASRLLKLEHRPSSTRRLSKRASNTSVNSPRTPATPREKPRQGSEGTQRK